jgi:hypothetical protein
VRTSTAKKNGYRCPICNDETTCDERGMGFVRHKRNPKCEFEKGERDESALPNSDVWQTSLNRDTGSLPTGTIRLEVGDVIEIRSEGRERRVTYAMGSAGRWYACFKGQGAVPIGQLDWRIVCKIECIAAINPKPAAANSPILQAGGGRLHNIRQGLEIIAMVVGIIGAIIALAAR